MNRLGIFGGTFDPPHLAHLIAAERAVEACALDSLLFVPANIPPHKAEVEISSAAHRLAMTRLAIQGNDKLGISEMELRRPPPSYTIDSLRELRGKHPAASLFLFIGMDQLAAFETWREPDAILQAAHVFVMARPSHGLDAISTRWRDQVDILPIPMLEISSTDIRERVRVGRSVRYLVPEPVREYIENNRLYTA